ncbi:MAG: hypothetical protein COX62_03235 [Deltaproteobacteria bacterium CG_4_10_14_0_2_um_filter_43_8]|nr:MAG: hypothetical protein COV43_01110 [Deltaproteobacteria bacterium CG11_big_fil_rev_8_21_14_0_20_42_23]PJA21127.1 MAG: hypothetical protein COX62_03235 [Deltaproteobacteria bacterium CG_4_10_14_0_2_um_filter_43_8]PJC63550.1 MAG: hypothetical protein CO021_08880 [Deltaproteobacteria bacterium CG_4_9_14_0_2_um_filter_42_21]
MAVSDASSEVHQIYNGFNQMAEGLEDAAKQERIMFEQQLLVKIAQQVAHDIRSPLSSLKTFSEYFGHLHLPDENYSDYYNLLGLSIKRLNGIVDGLLEKNTKNVEASSYFSLYQVLDELVGEYENQEQFKKITFEKKYSEQAIFLSGNARKLQRCFGNIIKNAIEAMNYNGAVIIRVTANCDMASVSIEDDGPGMSDEKLNRILQGGFSEGKADGHGIGMTVVKEAVTTHGGKLSASSQLEKGTTFLIELPLSKNLVTRKQRINSSPQEVFTLSCQSTAVLIVDDDENMREQWRLILKKHGKEAVLCSSYEDCELILPSHLKMTTAIVDYHFENSEKNGLDVIEFLKENGFTHLSLCTAEYWKPSIQNLVKKFEVGLCPKPLPHIEITTS